MVLLRKYLLGSFFVHLAITLIAGLISIRTHRINQTFIVFGAHSRRPTAVSYKSIKAEVPFVTKEQDKKAVAINRTIKSQKPSNKTHPVKKIVLKKIAQPRKAAPTEKKAAPKKQSPVVEKKQTASVKNPPEESKATNAPKKENTKKQASLPKKTAVAVPRQKEKALNENPRADKAVEKTATQTIKDQAIVQNAQSLLPVKEVGTSAALSQSDQTESQHDDLGTLMVGDDNFEQMSEYQKIVHQEAGRVWRPPVGVPKGTIAFVTFIIAQDGTHENELTQSSPVIIYDLSVMRAARAMKFPKSLWGKQFKIAFRQ